VLSWGEHSNQYGASVSDMRRRGEQIAGLKFLPTEQLFGPPTQRRRTELIYDRQCFFSHYLSVGFSSDGARQKKKCTVLATHNGPVYRKFNIILSLQISWID